MANTPEGRSSAAGSGAAPLVEKLGIRPGDVVALIGAPPGFESELAERRPGVVFRRQARGRADVVVAFFTRRRECERRIGALARMVFPAGGLWVAWPKRASGVGTDMSDDVVRQVALPLGLVDNKVCAVDATWSGLRVVWRRERRGEPPL